MGRYINWADVTAQYPGVAKIIDQTIVATQTIVDAEAEVDARLAPKYTVPFDTTTPALVPGLLRSLCVDLTYYKLSWMQESADKLKTYIDERFAAILDGTMMLAPLAQLNQLTPSSSNSYRSAFGLDNPLNWTESQSQADDLDNERCHD